MDASDTEKLKFDDSDEAPFDDSRQKRTLQLPTTPSPYLDFLNWL